MVNDIRLIQATFFTRANTVFHKTYESFCKEAALIDRSGKENEYQLLRSVYSRRLSQLLQQKASVIIERYDPLQSQQGLGANLAATIRYFETEFLRKTDEA